MHAQDDDAGMTDGDGDGEAAQMPPQLIIRPSPLVRTSLNTLNLQSNPKLDCEVVVECLKHAARVQREEHGLDLPLQHLYCSALSEDGDDDGSSGSDDDEDDE